MASNPKPLQRKHRQALLAELVARARSRLPEWRPGGDGQDLAYALFEIAARLGTEVEQRLDQIPEKNRRGFMHWLGLRGQAGRAARAPVVFSMVRGAEAIDAPARVQLQASALEPPVTLETEHPLRILPARLRTLVASSPRQDGFSIAPTPLLALEGPGQGGTRWTITRISSKGDEAIAQANPPQGLEKGMILQDESGRHHEVIDSNNGLIRLRRTPDDAPSVVMTLADRFQPFADGKGVIDRQTHALYIGDEALLDLSTEAKITICGAGIGQALLQADWAYWGTKEDNRDGPSVWCPLPPPVWCPLPPPPSHAQADKWITLTKSGNGIIKALELGGRASRWLRAQPNLEQNLSALDGPAISDLTLSVKVEEDKATNTCEGIANTTPLVLNQGFYPLGREPRQFDAFYLGSDEAFSKKGAEVTLDLTLGDQFATPFFWVDADATRYLFAIGNDGKLRGYRVDNAGSPKRFINTTPSVNGQPVQFNTKARPAAVFIDQTIYVAAIEDHAADSGSIWILRITHNLNNDAQWQKLLSFHPPKDNSQRDCVLLADNTDPKKQSLCIYTITNEGIARWTTSAKKELTEVIPEPTSSPIIFLPINSGTFVRLTPIFGSKCPSKLEIIAIYTDGNATFIGVSINDSIEKTQSKAIILGASSKPYPYGRVASTDVKIICIYYLDTKWFPSGTEVSTRKPNAPEIKTAQKSASQESSVAIIQEDNDLVLFVSSEEGISGKKFSLHAWRPFDSQVPIAIPDHPVEADITQGPVIAGNMILLATKQGTIISATRDKNLSWKNIGSIKTIFGIDAGSDTTKNTLIAIQKAENVRLKQIIDTTLKFDKSISAFEDKTNSTLGFDKPDLFLVNNNKNNHKIHYHNKTWKLDEEITSRHVATKINNEVFFVFEINQTDRISLTPIGKIHSGNNGTSYDCHSCEQLTEMYKISHLKLSSDVPRDLADVSLKYIEEGSKEALNFKYKDFRVREENESSNIYYFLDSNVWGKKGSVVAHRPLEWTTAPTEKPRNPTLSWEYWNGRSWWQIKVTDEVTGNLINTGKIVIITPDDIEPTDVLGRRNHWIRARLVGGDYGEARTTVTLETDGNKQHQTIHRDADSINAPYVAVLKLGYTTSKCNPQAVLTQDNGSWHDQSAAARTAGASLQCFVSLASALKARETDPQGDEGPWQQRGLYLGFDAPLSGQGLSLFCLVDTPAGDAPDLRLALDVLGKDGFRPVTGLQDGTGGLQQSGTLVFNLSETPVAAELFGQSAWWLRLRMADPARESDWNPILRGAWLNGAWAIAADTLTMEILGSATGAPSQSVRLTHSPVVEGSLELRVREPLGDEEVAALLAEDADAVRQNVADRPGTWVRWHELDDIDDAGQGQRAYALDDASGEIRFGDGVHGRAPDGGQDAIVAFSYRRGGGAQANGIKAWSPTNLSTPLQGVDECQIVDGAAGGSDAQDGERALAFAPARLQTRERALTLADLENLTRQFSPDIAQARAWTSGQQSRLVVVMARRGSPEPDRGTLRELRKYLVARSLPGLVRHLGLRRPRQHPLSVQLQLWADDLSLSGQLEAKAYQRIEQLLDPASGGLDQQGWPLGSVPSEADIAAALDDLGDGCGLISVEIRDADGKRALPPLARDELVTLAPKGVRCEITQGGTTPAARQEGPCHA